MWGVFGLVKFSGIIQSIKYASDATGYFVLNVWLDQQNKSAPVVGNILGINVTPGVWFSFEGEWDVHPKWGAQIKITKAPLFDEQDPEVVYQTLTSHGVSQDLLRRVRDHFGDGFVAALSSVEQLSTHLSEDEANNLHERWRVTTSIFRSIEILSGLGISNQKIREVWRAFPDNIYQVLTENPWALVKVEGIKFSLCDSLAEQLKIPLSSIRRVEGAVLYSVRESRSSGSLFVGTGNVVQEMRKLLGKEIPPDQIGTAMKNLHLERQIVIDKTTNVTALYEPWNFTIEDYSASVLAQRVSTAKLSEEVIQRINRMMPNGETVREKIENEILNSRAGNFQLSDQQIKAVVNALTEPVSILTGGPGSGKTTTLKTIVRLLKDLSIPFSLVAPTGIAAKRIQAVTGVPAATIHREFEALGFSMRDENATYEGIVSTSSSEDVSDGSDSAWGRNQQCPIDAEVVIVDETSMVDQHCLYRMLSGTKENCRFMFVGDSAQLPSVGAGNVLADLIKSKAFPTVSLTEIFRQEDTSDIVFVASDINNGVIPNEAHMQKDFIFIEESDDQKILSLTLELVQRFYDQRSSFQVMSPRHRGTLGVTNLNGSIRKMLNPRTKSRREVMVGDDHVREEDRIMIIQNDYSLEVFNGELGKINFIADSRQEIEVKIHDRPPRMVLMKHEDARRLLRLAYSITIHRFQGQETDVVILPWVKSFGQQLRRNLLYTAVTRAKKRVILIGQKDAFHRAILNGQPEVRNTLLSERINSYLEEVDND